MLWLARLSPFTAIVAQAAIIVIVGLMYMSFISLWYAAAAKQSNPSAHTRGNSDSPSFPWS